MDGFRKACMIFFSHIAAIKRVEGGLHSLGLIKDIKTSLIQGTEVGRKEIKLLVKTTSGFIKELAAA